MRETGILVHWDDERGFGFVETGHGSRVFVHVTSIARKTNRPKVGDALTFDMRTGRDGRQETHNVRVLGANPVGGARRLRGRADRGTRLDWRLPLAALLLALAGLSVISGNAPFHLLVFYAGMGLVSFLLYRADKAFAQSGSWRISEVMLLSADLAFGIIGGLIAQALFRHKTRKISYVGATIALTIVHLVWLGGTAGGFINWNDFPALFLGGEV